MPTLLSLRTQTSQRLNQPLVSADVPASGVFWTRAELNTWLNEACLQIWSEIVEGGGAASLITETDGTYPASTRRHSLQTLLGVTDDPLEITEVRDVTSVSNPSLGRLIDYKPHGQFMEWLRGLEPALYFRTGMRSAWTWSGANPMRIELFPVPTSTTTLRIRYVPAAPPALLLDGDSPLWLPTAHHGLLVAYAVVQAKQKERSDWRPEWELYQEKLQRLRESIEDRQQQTSRGPYIVDPSEYGRPT